MSRGFESYIFRQMEPLTQPHPPKFLGDAFGYTWDYRIAKSSSWSVNHGDTNKTRTTFIIGLNKTEHKYDDERMAVGYRIHLGSFILAWTKII